MSKIFETKCKEIANANKLNEFNPFKLLATFEMREKKASLGQFQNCPYFLERKRTFGFSERGNKKKNVQCKGAENLRAINVISRFDKADIDVVCKIAYRVT